LTKNSKVVAIVGILAVVFAIVIYFVWDLALRRPAAVACSDGSHYSIDIRDFTTNYWAYSAKLEASVADRAKTAVQLDPKMLTQVSEALQEANEFRKYTVAGYNSCAITKVQYAQFGTRFHTLDGVAREIDSLLAKPSISQEESARLGELIRQYGDLARQLGSH